jgi:hypothetical protein
LFESSQEKKDIFAQETPLMEEIIQANGHSNQHQSTKDFFPAELNIRQVTLI